MPYPTVEPQPNFPRIEERIARALERDGTFRTSIDPPGGSSTAPTSTSSTTARRSPTACRTTATC